MLNEELIKKAIQTSDKLNGYAKTQIKNWDSIGAGDPLKIISELVAVSAAQLEQQIDHLPSLLARELPGIFGLHSRFAVPSRGMVQVTFNSDVKESVYFSRGLKLEAKTESGVIGFSVMHEQDLFNAGEIEIIKGEKHIFIGLEKIPELSKTPTLTLYFDLEEPLKQTDVRWFMMNQHLEKTAISSQDFTAKLQKSGLITFFIAPATLQKSKILGLNRYWLKLEVENPLIDFLIRKVSADVMAVENTFRREYFEISGTGRKGTSYKLPEGELVQDFEVWIDNPDLQTKEKWECVETFLLSGSQSKHYRINMETHALEFGDGERGAIPPPGFDNIVIKNLVLCDGVNGNFSKKASLELKDSDWKISHCEFINHPHGGVNRAKSDDLMRALHEKLRNQGRAINKRDTKELLLESNPRLGRSYVLPQSQSEDYGYLETIVLVKPEYSAHRESLNYTPSGRDLELASEFLSERKLMNAQISVKGPAYKKIVIHGKIFVRRLTPDVQNDVLKDIRDFFDPYGRRSNLIEPGMRLYREDLISYLERHPKILSISAIKLEDEAHGVCPQVLTLSRFEFPEITLKIRFEESSL